MVCIFKDLTYDVILHYFFKNFKIFLIVLAFVFKIKIFKNYTIVHSSYLILSKTDFQLS